MAKTLILLATSVTSADTIGRDFVTPRISTLTDQTADDLKAFAGFFRLTSPQSAHGRLHMELQDKDGTIIAQLDEKMSATTGVFLSTEAGAAAAGSANGGNDNQIHWIVDAATFSSGLVRVELGGRYSGAVRSQASISGFARNSYVEIRDMSGPWAVDLPFTVTE